jgi:hypothetical protein
MATQLVPEKNRECLDACADYVAACEGCAQHCIAAAEQEMVTRVRQRLDCAALCQACVTLLARDAQYAGELCGLCANACEACATECERFDDELMAECARTCRRAAELCRAMAA